jgi:hypothetical protein
MTEFSYFVKTNLSMLTERSPQAWRPARINGGLLWVGSWIWGLFSVQALVSLKCSPWSSLHASNVTAANVSLERTWQVTVLGTLRNCFSTLQKNNRQQFIAAGTNPKVVELKLNLAKVAPFSSIVLLYSLCTSNCNWCMMWRSIYCYNRELVLKR